MKKIFINDLDTEKRNDLIKKNTKLINMLKEDLYEVNLYMQQYDTELMLGKDYHQYLQYHDDYNSFYFTITNWRKFITNVEKSWLSNDTIDTYDYIMSKLDDLDALCYYDEEYYKLDEELEEKCKIILDDLEDLLHSYEEYPNEDDAIQYADDMEQLNEYYIEEHEDGFCDGVIRKDIAYTETFI